MTLVIDGVAIENLTRFRAQSGLFAVTLPDGNILHPDLDGETGVSLADGYYIMLAPLSKGDHTLSFAGCLGSFGGCANFELSILYNLTVE